MDVDKNVFKQPKESRKQVFQRKGLLTFVLAAFVSLVLLGACTPAGATGGSSDNAADQTQEQGVNSGGFVMDDEVTVDVNIDEEG